MIVFDLKCRAGHVFEAWFGSGEDYEAQKARGLLSCPLCGDGEIGKAVMAPAVRAKSNRSDGRVPVATGGEAEAMARLLAMQRALEAQSDWVGERFAEEARARHQTGEGRPVHGEASLVEVKALVDEGVPVMPLPFRPLAKSDA
jgi:hypothetical protein